MTKSRVDKVLFSALLLFGGLLFLLLTLPLGRMAQLVPIRVVVPTIALLGLQLIIDWRARQSNLSLHRQGQENHGNASIRHHLNAPSDRPVNTPVVSGNAVKEHPVLFLLVLLPMLIYLVGFILSAALFVWLYYRFYFKKPFLVSASLSLGAAVFLYLLMILLLGMDIQSGFIWNLSALAF